MRTFSLTDDQVDAIVVYELEENLRSMREMKRRLQDALDQHGALTEFERTDLADASRVVEALEIVLESYRVRSYLDRG